MTWADVAMGLLRDVPEATIVLSLTDGSEYRFPPGDLRSVGDMPARGATCFCFGSWAKQVPSDSIESIIGVIE